MQFYLYQILSSILFSITLTFVNAQNQDNIFYKTCNTPFHCGNLKNITYPFWGPDRPKHCGHPSFFVNCINQTLFITTRQLDYQILHIDTNSQSLTVSRSDYSNTICPSRLLNTTFDQNLFAYASDVHNITLYYGCDIPSQSSPNRFSCRLNNTFLDGYFLTGSLNTSSLSISLSSCDDSVIVPVMKSADRFVQSSPSQSNLMEALNQGFGWQWSAKNSLCETCTSSGGLCGHNTTTNSFSCYCPDQNHPFLCPSEGGDYMIFPLSAGNSILVSLAAVCSCVVCCCCCCCCCFSRRGRFWMKLMFFGWKKTEEDKKIEAFMMNYQSLIANSYLYG